jgi:hypothetical protein
VKVWGSAAAVAGASLLALAAPQPHDVAALPGLQWAPTIGAAGHDDSGQALAWNKADGSVVVAGISLPSGTTGQPGTYWLRRVDPQGRVATATAVPFERGRGPLSRTHRYFGGLAVLAGGDALAVIEMGPLRPVLVRATARGEIVFAKAIAEHSTSIARLVAAESGRYLIAGFQGPDAFVAKLDEHGQILWQRRFDRGENEAFSDVVPTEYGGFVAAGTSALDDPTKGTRVWVVRGGADGLRQADAVFEGRGPALAQAGAGRYALVYDTQKDAFAYDVHLAVLDSGLRTLSSTRLLDKQAGFPVRQSIVAHPRGGFLVGSARGLGLWLARLEAALAVAWTWADAPTALPGGAGERVWHQWPEAFVAASDAVFVLSSVQNVGAADNHLDAGLLKLVEP